MTNTKEQIIKQIQNSDLFLNLTEQDKAELISNIKTANDMQLEAISSILTDSEKTFFESADYQKLIQASKLVDVAYLKAQKAKVVQGEQQSLQGDDQALKNLEEQM